MKLTVADTVGLPPGPVGRMLADPERLARGIEEAWVEPIGPKHWTLGAMVKGQAREGEIRLAEHTETDVVYNGQMDAYGCICRLVLRPFAGGKTRITAHVEFTAQGMAGRIGLSALKLARPRVERGAEKAMRRLIKRLERRLRGAGER